MKKYSLIILVCYLLAMTWSACKKDRPVDEDGLLITTRAECYVSSFELLGTDYVTVRSKAAVIDTTAQTVRVEVLFGTDLKNVYPQFTLAQDCKLDPKITGRTDLSDTLNPRTYTVVSGNRQIRKPYKLYVTVQH
ncbi:hypothetical protein [Flavisolibacter ginsenosidimutans]|uniref:DUF1735 domain-containing protein n=1 Tax=Flavisolibacter ginsenosidimutans TaxID=661481 RepID=A0A5B8UN11_9BACT|nr:hypothetical protein [Flavisolibacter ginsenosidimutans]QEC57953.1 hypothetical protein FSB75_19255 [Flavisolibacter ginsenosidimutans]